MTADQIREMRDREQRKYDVMYDLAIEIRRLLDEAAARYVAEHGADQWDHDDVESTVIGLVVGAPPSDRGATGGETSDA
jgi:hypothetical protein